MQEETINKKIDAFINSFTALGPLSNTENLYDSNNKEGMQRAHNVKLYLRLIAQQKPDTLLIGEAPGYQGTTRTGIPFCSEFIMEKNMPEASFFNNAQGFRRVFDDTKIFKEPTSTIMWRTLSQYKKLPLLWAVFPHHPYIGNNLLSNRTPTTHEVKILEHLLIDFLSIFEVKQVLSVGNTAKNTLDSIGISSIKIRHPSHGGANIFAKQLFEAMS